MAAMKYVDVADYIASKKITVGRWYDITIPLSDLQAVDQVIGAVVVEIENPGTFWVGKISFTNAPDSRLVPAVVSIPKR